MLNKILPDGYEYLTVSGVKLEVKRYPGDAGKPTLVFLHEGLGCTDMWRDFPEKLAVLTACPALVYSRQGYGRSDACDVPRPLRYMHIEALQVLPELLRVAEIQEHILLGHSDGGSISLINASGKPAEGLLAIVTMAAHVFCEELTIASIKQSTPAYVDGELRPGLEKYHRDNVDGAFWGWNNVWLNPDFMQWNIEQYLPAIKVPQLVIQGKQDPYGTTAQVESIVAHSGGSVDVLLLDDCLHSPYKEKSVECLGAIQRFLIAHSIVS